MELKAVLSAINRMEADLLIITQELTKQGLSKHPVARVKKQSRLERCLEMVAQQRILDKLKAQKMFAARLKSSKD